jgi:hypothetical protein
MSCHRLFDPSITPKYYLGGNFTVTEDSVPESYNGNGCKPCSTPNE